MRCFAGLRRSRVVAGRVVVAALMGVPVVTLAPFNAGVAHAAMLDLALCLEYDGNSYTPGITFTPRPTNISSSGVLGPCVSMTDPTLTSGSYQGSGTGNVSCTGGTFAGTVIYHWNNGRDSTVSYTAVIGTRLGAETVVLYKGKVTDGEFKGYSYTSPLTALNLLPLNCLSPQGVTSTSGPSLSVFTPPL
jgi:hypothetical protein